MSKPKPTQDNDALSGFRARGDVIPIWAMLGPAHDNMKVYAAHVPWVPLSMRGQPKRVDFPRKALGWRTDSLATGGSRFQDNWVSWPVSVLYELRSANAKHLRLRALWLLK